MFCCFVSVRRADAIGSGGFGSVDLSRTSFERVREGIGTGTRKGIGTGTWKGIIPVGEGTGTGPGDRSRGKKCYVINLLAARLCRVHVRSLSALLRPGPVRPARRACTQRRLICSRVYIYIYTFGYPCYEVSEHLWATAMMIEANNRDRP